MMLNPVAIKHSQTFRPVSNDAMAMKIGQELVDQDERDFKEAAIEDVGAGRCVFYKSDAHPEFVCELIGGTISADSVVTLYETDGIFSSRSAYIAARIELIKEVAAVFGNRDNFHNCAIKDNSRNRMVLLSELGTAQLIDILNDSERRVQVG